MYMYPERWNGAGVFGASLRNRCLPSLPNQWTWGDSSGGLLGGPGPGDVAAQRAPAYLPGQEGMA